MGIFFSLDADKEKTDSSAGPYLSVFKNNEETSTSIEEPTPYKVILPSEFDIFNQANIVLNEIDNENLKGNTVTILKSVEAMLIEYAKNLEVDKYLSRMHLSHDEDNVLIEWNFEKFRFGIVVDEDMGKTSLYRVSQDATTGSFSAMSHQIGKENKTFLRRMLSDVMENA
jgi:hypothetical protein